MSLFALDALWNDIYTAGGFWVGVLGTAVGIAGFWIAITQIRETRKAAEAGQKAAEAAREAANKTLKENKEGFERFVAAHAGRLLSELQRAVVSAEWNFAELRSSDLAEILATLPTSGTTTDGIIAEVVIGLREFSHTFSEMIGKKAAKLPPKTLKEKWKPLLRSIHTRLDQLRAPFREISHGEITSSYPTEEASRDYSEPSREDESGPSEMGETTDTPGGP